MCVSHMCYQSDVICVTQILMILLRYGAIGLVDNYGNDMVMTMLLHGMFINDIHIIRQLYQRSASIDNRNNSWSKMCLTLLKIGVMMMIRLWITSSS
jgi:hypothetical protein